jgi:hypothetical protein
MLRYLDAIVAIDPNPAQERAMRVELRYRAGDVAGALADVNWLLEKNPDGLDVAEVKKMQRFLERALREREAQR